MDPLWSPTNAQIQAANLTRFMREVGGSDFETLHRWSVERREEFWVALWKFADVIADARAGREPWDEVLVGRDRMAPPDPDVGPRWFSGARLNFAENLLRRRDDHPALVFWNELGRQRSVSYRDLSRDVARVAAALRGIGIGPGDRVAAFMPNMAETAIAMLAAASLGAIWSSCSPDFGASGVLDRFGQIQPRVLFCASSYRYGGREIDCLARVREIVLKIPQIERVVVVPYLAPGDLSGIRGAVAWDDFAAMPSRDAPEFTRLPFDHPLYIMYSSGTTGLPKCMVHGAGGTLLQHRKEHLLHCDLTAADRLFYFTTCGWMMWNWLMSGLASGCTLVLYDGSPLLRKRPVLWDLAAAEEITIFGTSAKYLALVEKEGVRPVATHDLSALSSILSTGSPLAPQSFDYVYSAVKRDVRLSSISGGTDIISCFAGGNPIAPVWRGEIQSLALAMSVEVFDDNGHPLRGQPGELVCTAPFPSMPIAFWNDPEGALYGNAYFSTYPNVWRHGDWCEITAHGGMIIYGRSDTTLNPSGVRIGTAEIYRQVEQLDEVVESIVVGQDVTSEFGTDVRIVLFVRLRDGVTITEALRDRIRRQIRDNTSPHHVPKKIIQVADIPRTISGKITELAVREVIHGRPVKNADALANPQALALFRDLEELQ
ncbi:MAG: acetoacetate--CoA ligase [Gemmatimonadaceae bacterium]